jgi:hypothetical protein
MNTQLIDSLASVLRQEGFRSIERRKSSVSTTLTAERDGTTVVVHVNQGELPVSALAVQHSLAPAGLEIMMKASLPGFRAPTQEVEGDPLHAIRQGSGGGGGGRPAGVRLEEDMPKLG